MPSDRCEPGVSVTFTNREESSGTVLGCGLRGESQQTRAIMAIVATTAAERARNFVAGAGVLIWRTATGISSGETSTGWEFRYRLSKRPKCKFFCRSAVVRKFVSNCCLSEGDKSFVKY